MENKNIFEKPSKKIAYYVIAGVCVAAVGVLSFMSYNAIGAPKDEEPPKTDITDDVGVPKDDVPKDDTDITPPVTEPEPEPEPEPQPDTETASKGQVTVKSKPYIMPVSGDITVTFSLTDPIYSNTLGDWRIHDGIDISAPLGSNVVAVNDGVVDNIENDDLFGITVTIKHTDGKKSVYSNLEDSVELEKGQIINQGDIVGKVGQSAVYEISDGPHLHLEMSENGQKIDPAAIITKNTP